MIRKFGLLAVTALVGTGAFASTPLDWGLICYDGTTTSTDYILEVFGTPMWGTQVAVAGTAPSFGGTASAGQCLTVTVGYWGQSVSTQAGASAGSLSFTSGDPFSSFSGEVGSIQTTRDDYMLNTFGAPDFFGSPWSYSMVLIDGAKSAVPAFSTYFVGQSDRYVYAEAVVGSTTVNLRVDGIGDASRVQWRLVNGDAAAHTLGIWSGQWDAMMIQPATAGGLPPTAGVPGIYMPFYPGPIKPVYVTLPHNNPPTTEHRYVRATAPSTFPEYVNVLYSQNIPYGVRIENGPLDANVFDTIVHGGVHDSQQIDTAGADEFVFGSSHYLLGGPSGGGDMPDFIFPEVFPGANYSDVDPRPEGAYIQKWNDTDHSIAAGDERVIVQYYRSTWSNADYRLPYATVVDAPKTFQPTPGSPSTLSPANARVRVYVDNTGGYSKDLTGLDINNVQITFRTPASSGIKLDATDQPQESQQVFNGVSQIVRYSTKTITTIAPRRLDSVDFHVTPDNTISGDLPYEVIVTATPGPKRVLKGSIYASPTPTLALTTGANLVSVPWTFPDNSWTTVLGLAPGAFSAFAWDAVNKGYIPSTSATRGSGFWLVTNQDFPALSLNKSAGIPSDVEAGYKNILLYPGWNLVGNPYNYRVQLGEFVGTPQNDNQSYTWNDLVAQGFVSGNVATWDPVMQSYTFQDGYDAIIDPQQGYWIYVQTGQPLALKFPPVYYPGILPVTSRAATVWNKDVSRWRLNLVASTAKSLDDKNYVGQVPSVKEVNAFTALKPPMSPVSGVEVSVDQTINGKVTRAAQAYATSAPKTDWTIHVYSKNGGRVKLTWPNMSQVSRGLTFRLVDPAAGVSRDMRQLSGYDFDSKKDSSRDLHVQVATGGSVRAMIGDVLAVHNGSRGLSGSFTVSYTLSGDATTSTRILSATGREVYSITRGRADRAGQNVVTWNLRDNANRAVAPGSYRVEVVAESTNGERSRRVIPINVIR